MRTYQELIQLPSFLERFRYLQLHGLVGKATFGFDRWLNQKLYSSYEWRRLRRDVILRDNGCDLACAGHELDGHVYVHHMNPISVGDIAGRTDLVLNPDYLITVSFETHQAIHYGDESLLAIEPPARTPNDTCPWRA